MTHSWTLPDDDYSAALAAAAPREALMLRLSAELGLRCGEVCQVHSSDILGKTGEWLIIVHGKGDKERTLPLDDSLAASLQALPSGFRVPRQLQRAPVVPLRRQTCL